MPRNTILVVDDEPTNCEVASIILTTLGHTVVTCSNGAEAVALCLADPGRFDAVLMDVLMPVMDGLEAIRRLRAEPSTQGIPIVCVSARASGSDRAAGLAAGCDRYVTKPYKRKDLIAALAELGID